MRYKLRSTPAGHKSFAKNVQAFVPDAVSSESPPRTSVPRGNPAADKLSSAVGRPSGLQTSDGMENKAANYKTFVGGDGRRSSGGGKSRTPAGVQTFDADAV